MIASDSPEWSGLKEWLLAEIATEQANLESPGCKITEADQIRGRLMAYRHIISTVQPPPMIEEPITRPPRQNY